MENRKVNSIGGLTRGILIMTTFAIFYSILEIGMYWNPGQGILRALHNNPLNQYFYRFIYISIFLYPAYLSSKRLISIRTIWYAIYGFLIEDIFYWIFALRLPYTWSWYYPVYHGIPIPDLLEFLLLLLLLKKIT